jgi:1-acyl-sn-glycerol-3-phosphate acyltransferase
MRGRVAGIGAVIARLRGAAHMLGLGLLTVLYAPVAMPLLLAPPRWRHCFVRHWARMTLCWLRVAGGVGVEIEGIEHLPPGPVVLLVNHQSAWETFALLALLPRPVTFVLKRELLRIPLFGWGLNLMGPVAIDRAAPRAALHALLRRGSARLAAGASVVVFPEGTRAAPGERRPWQAGGALLAQHAGVPVVPVAHDSGRYWARRGLARYPGRVCLRIGPPLMPAGDAPALTAQAQAWVEGALARLYGS